jgi:hypothetical protein
MVGERTRIQTARQIASVNDFGTATPDLTGVPSCMKATTVQRARSCSGAAFGGSDAAFEELVDDLLEHRQHQPVNTGDLQR